MGSQRCCVRDKAVQEKAVEHAVQRERASISAVEIAASRVIAHRRLPQLVVNG